jgi:hypothetical protein
MCNLKWVPRAFPSSYSWYSICGLARHSASSTPQGVILCSIGDDKRLGNRSENFKHTQIQRLRASSWSEEGIMRNDFSRLDETVYEFGDYIAWLWPRSLEAYLCEQTNSRVNTSWSSSGGTSTILCGISRGLYYESTIIVGHRAVMHLAIQAPVVSTRENGQHKVRRTKSTTGTSTMRNLWTKGIPRSRGKHGEVNEQRHVR